MVTRDTVQRSQGTPRKDHTARRKVIWKGKIAPKGYYYLVVKVKNGKGGYEASRLLKGPRSTMVEDKVEIELRELLTKKYGC